MKDDKSVNIIDAASLRTYVDDSRHKNKPKWDDYKKKETKCVDLKAPVRLNNPSRYLYSLRHEIEAKYDETDPGSKDTLRKHVEDPHLHQRMKHDESAHIVDKKILRTYVRR